MTMMMRAVWTVAAGLLVASTTTKSTTSNALDLGSRDRFWRHHVDQESLVFDGVDHYSNIKSCIRESMTPEEYPQIPTVQSDRRKTGRKVVDPFTNGNILVVVENAIHPIHVKAVQSLAACVRKHIPSLYESRAMYQEMDLETDPGLGGNCPTHLAPLVSVFLPDVVREMQVTLNAAFRAAGWQAIVSRDYRDDNRSEKRLVHPDQVGIRASEHLTYTDFPALADHDDGATTYTMNFAFTTAGVDYQGGEFFVKARRKKRDRTGGDDDVFVEYVKPKKYDAIVFLGGRYLHGVTEITGGHREMFSTEYWPYPDTPFGSTLWSNTPQNIKEYIRACNEEQEQNGGGPCTVTFSDDTAFGGSLKDVRDKYSIKKEYANDPRGPPTVKGINRTKDDIERPNRISPSELKLVYVDRDGNQFDPKSFKSRKEEPDFLVPEHLEPGEMHPIRWREDRSLSNLNPNHAVDGPDGETFVIGFPPQLHKEFLTYIDENGMMRVAHQILYREERLSWGEQRLYTLDDGEKWTAMVQGAWKTDMVWLDPGDESTFESLLGVLRRGGFDRVLDQIGKAFDLNSLMIQGVGAIFLSKYNQTKNIHVDIEGSRGSFYNIIVPVHIPVGHDAVFVLSDRGDDYKGGIKLDPNVGIVLGGESRHGTGKCNYRATEDFRLSFAVYVADINEENVDLIASDSTSLWPTDGDTKWFWAQKERLWTKDGKNSLRHDKGRQPLNVQDLQEDCPKLKDQCEKDLKGVRLRCPKTCGLYLEDEAYYRKFFPDNAGPPYCSADNAEDPTCLSLDASAM